MNALAKIMRAIETEKKWCKENPGKNPEETKDFDKGFIKGLELAQFFIREAIKKSEAN